MRVNQVAHNTEVSGTHYIKLKSRSFHVIMKASYLHKGLNVHLLFAYKHFPKGCNLINLYFNGKYWSVRLYNYDTKAAFRGGWKNFVGDNGISVGDCCVFNVSKKNSPIHITVDILRATRNHALPLRNGRKQSPHEIEDSTAPQAARNFKSNYPFYSVYMHKSYARREGMIVKAAFVRKHLTDVGDTVTLLDSHGRRFAIGFAQRKGQGRLGAGWAEFAKINNIHLGDACVFELIAKTDTETVLRTTIFRGV
ncbi:B3 domain-containing protein Os03g0620400-like [Telopea speciosissima]|uniref:B3 domain-containing protein Os03g0620400-like n=1 Tax=Telopea speciosissima TaxID=54955 RepID=UPI001CC61D24|nr:B3 domain-containing protein Os03g0620400-like [Telopea speciosissima]